MSVHRLSGSFCMPMSQQHMPSWIVGRQCRERRIAKRTVEAEVSSCRKADALLTVEMVVETQLLGLHATSPS